MRDLNIKKSRLIRIDLDFILIVIGIAFCFQYMEHKTHEKEIYLRDELITLQQSNIKKLEVIVNENYNHVKRMQIIAGVDTIKDVFSYKMKVLNPINQTQLLKKDFRVKKCRQ